MFGASLNKKGKWDLGGNMFVGHPDIPTFRNTDLIISQQYKTHHLSHYTMHLLSRYPVICWSSPLSVIFPTLHKTVPRTNWRSLYFLWLPWLVWARGVTVKRPGSQSLSPPASNHLAPMITGKRVSQPRKDARYVDHAVWVTSLSPSTVKSYWN